MKTYFWFTWGWCSFLFANLIVDKLYSKWRVSSWIQSNEAAGFFVFRLLSYFVLRIYYVQGNVFILMGVQRCSCILQHGIFFCIKHVKCLSWNVSGVFLWGCSSRVIHIHQAAILYYFLGSSLQLFKHFTMNPEDPCNVSITAKMLLKVYSMLLPK